MAKGNWAATSASVVIVAANEYRDTLTLQKTNDTDVSLGLGEAAVLGEGVQMLVVGDAVTLRGYHARNAVYAIGNGGQGTYQDGPVEVHPVK